MRPGPARCRRSQQDRRCSESLRACWIARVSSRRARSGTATGWLASFRPRSEALVPRDLGSRRWSAGVFLDFPGVGPRPVMSTAGFSAPDRGRGWRIRKARRTTVVEAEIFSFASCDRRPEVREPRSSGIDAVGTRERGIRRDPATPKWENGRSGGLRTRRNRTFDESSGSNAVGMGIPSILPTPTRSVQELFDFFRLRRGRYRRLP